jgi:predicted metal-dependent phosphoesterase TrpH
MESFLRAQSPIDLHMHSNRSDGTDSPAGVVREAHAHGVRTMALTDHDMFDGWAEAEAECLALGMTFIPGAELSTTGGPGVGGMHLLAYLFDPLEPQLASAMLQVTGGSESRIREIVERLQEDYDIEFDDVLAEANGAPPQRPHVAGVLVKNGYVPSVDHAFAEILSSSSRYYIPKTDRGNVLDVIRLVRGAGGVPIIAHPVGRSGGVMPLKNLEILLEAGLAGFELDHRENFQNPEGLARLHEYARDYNLIVTGSSDYHGDNKENRPGENTTQPEMLARIIEQATGNEPRYPEESGAA